MGTRIRERRRSGADRPTSRHCGNASAPRKMSRSRGESMSSAQRIKEHRMSSDFDMTHARAGSNQSRVDSLSNFHIDMTASLADILGEEDETITMGQVGADGQLNEQDMLTVAQRLTSAPDHGQKRIRSLSRPGQSTRQSSTEMMANLVDPSWTLEELGVVLEEPAASDPRQELLNMNAFGPQLDLPTIATMPPIVVPAAGSDQMRGSSSKPAAQRPKLTNATAASCKCCGAVGFYTKSCGKKHQCLVGKCDGRSVPDYIKQSSAGGANLDAPLLFRITCPGCNQENRFEVPTGDAMMLACWRCGKDFVLKKTLVCTTIVD